MPLGLLLAVAGVLTAVAIYRIQNEPLQAELAGQLEEDTSGKADYPFAKFYRDYPDDDEVVGRIGDSLIYRGDARRFAAFRLGWEAVDSSLAPSKTEQDALYQAIVYEIDLMIWNEAARQAGFTATDTEVDEYLADIREVCARKDECEFSSWHGMTIDEYIEYQRENTRQFLARRAFLQARIEEFPNRRITWDSIRLDLRHDYPALWFDPDIQAIYEAALADSAVNFEN